ncbi:MAG: AmmeMemoRadiSam system protein B [Bacteroidales bacterium]
MKKYSNLILIIVLITFASCGTKETTQLEIRSMVDTIGFAQYSWQMDSIMSRMNAQQVQNKHTWRIAISPHDDYTYVGNLYPKVLSGFKAKTVILFGVAHKARNYNLHNKIIFDSFDAWQAPYGNVKVSEIRNQIIAQLPDSLFLVHQEMQSVEHSLEAIVPFLQYYNNDVEIIPILVPYMSFDKLNQISETFASALKNILDQKNLEWGKDIAMVISNDAVHYGDQDWGDKNYAPFGTDSIGLAKARNHEMEIITNCLLDEVNIDKIQQFIKYTVSELDYKEYKWTWCGRYSIPFGLLTAYNLDKQLNGGGLRGNFIGYSNSIDHPNFKVDDLQMGTTAPANDHHWVGYAAVGYE